MLDYMLDLETIGLLPGSAIVSVGIVGFDIDTGTIGEEFYQVISRASCERVGLTENRDTIGWWGRQSERTYAAFREATEAGTDLMDVLIQISGFLPPSTATYRLWGNGSDFDVPILGAAFTAQGMPIPFAGYPPKPRCYRTIKNLARNIRIEHEAGGEHDALCDARAQAAHLCRIVRELGITVS